MAEPGVLARIVGRAAYEFSLMQPMLPTYGHLIVSALFPIWAGAHASLSRPSSAAVPPKKRSASHVPADGDESSDDEDDEEDEEDTHKMEGLSPSDALMMPLLAGCTLAGLYFLIKWLEDPKILNQILNAYFSLFGVFSVATLITDALDIGHSIIFPRRFAYRGALYHVNAKEKKAEPVAGNTKDTLALQSPLPGFLANLPLSDRLSNILWNDRAMPGNKWTIRMYLHRIFAGKVLIGPHGFVGFILSTIAVVYFNVVDKPWYLTNLMGFGFSYGALQLMSPTTFATGSLILSALFFYDIYFVFFTPMMVTVAKSLDVPIKLIFPRPSPAGSTSTIPQHAMLGLGDVVLPGIMIGLALRFDLFLFYLRRQTKVPSPITASANPTAEKEDGEPTTATVTLKPRYHSLAGRWSDHFWTHSLSGRPLFTTPSILPSSKSKPEPPFTFPKIYFTASIAGYIVGMLATLTVMHLWGHAQPALLYLVPGVLGSLWLTALVRGEAGLMWNFSEAVEEDSDTEDENSADTAGDGKTKQASKTERTSFFSLSDKKAAIREKRLGKALGKHLVLDTDAGLSESESESEAEQDEDVSKAGVKDSEDRKVDAETKKKTEAKTGAKARKVKQVAAHKASREVFSFSIEAPWPLRQPRSVIGGDKDVGKEGNDGGKEGGKRVMKGKPNWAPREVAKEEQAGKRIRLN